MFFRTIVAAFFIEVVQPDAPRPPLADLLNVAGVTDAQALRADERLGVGLHDPTQEAMYGHWSAFDDVWATLDRLEQHDCLQLYASMNRFLDAQQAAEDSLLPYTAAFRTACLRLEADVAFLDARAHYGDEAWENKQGNRKWVLDHYWMVLETDADALVDEGFDLLYLSEAVARCLTPPHREGRSLEPLPGGCLIVPSR